MISVGSSKLEIVLLFLILFTTSCAQELTNTPTQNTTFEPHIATTPPLTQTTAPTKVATHTRTIIPTPLGAGLVAPTFRVEFLTPYEKLTHGDYAIVPSTTTSDRRVYDLFYLRLNGKDSGKLLTIRSAGNEKIGIGTRSLSNGKELLLKWIDDKGFGGLLLINLETQEVRQYNMGCPYAAPVVHGTYISPGEEPFFAFSCDEKREEWNFVSTIDWQIVSEVFSIPPNENYMNDVFFLNENLALISDSFPFSKSNVKCLYKVKEAEKTCFNEVPNWWNPVSEVSPDGLNVVVWVSDINGESEGHGGIIPLRCIERPDGGDCLPDVLPELEGTPFWAPGSMIEKFWSPDGEKLMGHYITEDLTTSKLWIYDVITHEIKPLGAYPILELRGNPWVFGGNQVIAQTYSSSTMGPVGWAISTISGQMERIDERLPNLMYNWSLIHVP